MAKTKIRTMTMKLHDVRVDTEHTDEGVHRNLIIEDFGDNGLVGRRVRIPLYGANVRAISDAIKQWREALVEESKAGL